MMLDAIDSTDNTLGKVALHTTKAVVVTTIFAVETAYNIIKSPYSLIRKLFD
jgi:hypothetical protein